MSTVVYHLAANQTAINLRYHIHRTSILPTKHRHTYYTIREATETDRHLSNMNREECFYLRKSWKYPKCSMTDCKKTPSQDSSDGFSNELWYGWAYCPYTALLFVVIHQSWAFLSPSGFLSQISCFSYPLLHPCQWLLSCLHCSSAYPHTYGFALHFQVSKE